MTVRAAPLLNDPRKHVMVHFYDQNSAMNTMCSVYLLVAQPITIGGGKSSCWEEEEEEDGERVGQCTLDLISRSGCWTGLFQPFSLPEPEAAGVCWDLFGRQPSAAVFTKSISTRISRNVAWGLKQHPWIVGNPLPPMVGPPLLRV